VTQAAVPRGLVGRFMQSLSAGGGRKTDYDYEHSELLKYENRLLRESGDYNKALDHLEVNAAALCDPIEAMEAKARLLIGLGRRAEAETVVMALLRRNPHNERYYRWLEEATADSDRVALYARLRSQLPTTDSLLLQSLAAAAAAVKNSEVFREELAQFIGTKLNGGAAPGLFNSLRFLYKIRPEIGAIIGEVATAAVASAEQSDLVWGYCFLSQHWDWAKDYLLGLDDTSKALELEPDLVELYMVKAKLLKHSGQLMQAAEALEQAHSLDPTDRYVGSKFARYLLRAGHTEQALNVMRKYTKVRKSTKNKKFVSNLLRFIQILCTRLVKRSCPIL
jgi:tetratricopeptide (TPR) repeat protein